MHGLLLYNDAYMRARTSGAECAGPRRRRLLARGNRNAYCVYACGVRVLKAGAVMAPTTVDREKYLRDGVS